MTPVIEGRVWCFGRDVNTDLIQPVHALLKPVDQQPRYVFEANRPGWVDLVRPGDIIVAGPNFGTGSSRPAARVLKDLGLGGLLAESINGLFFRNCVNFAFAAVECDGVAANFSEGDAGRFDLRTGEVRNITTEADLAGRPWAPELLAIYQAGGLIQQLQAEGLLVDGSP